MPFIGEVKRLGWVCPNCSSENTVMYDSCEVCDTEVELVNAPQDNKQRDAINKIIDDMNTDNINGDWKCPADKFKYIDSRIKEWSKQLSILVGKEKEDG